MEIQQHDGVVVDVAGLRQGFAKLLREREVLPGRREAPKAVCCCPPSPLYIGPLGRGAGQNPSRVGGAAAKGGKGLPCPPRQGGSPPTLGFPTLGAWVAQGGAHQPTRGWFHSPLQPMGPSGMGGPDRWTPGTLPVVPIQYR